MGAGGGTHGLRRGIHGGRTGDPWILKGDPWALMPDPRRGVRSGRPRCAQLPEKQGKRHRADRGW
jgi:hypothetical protein